MRKLFVIQHLIGPNGSGDTEYDAEDPAVQADQRAAIKAPDTGKQENNHGHKLNGKIKQKHDTDDFQALEIHVSDYPRLY
ncbi:MAG: hypothetical protein IKH30_06090 [Clostridia bacterium]|nr:hypothetical protein [Clostridia bacterium]